MTAKEFREICEYIASLIKGTDLQDKVYAVGGCVRDEILRLDIKDIDLAVEMPDGGRRLAELLKEKDALSGDFVFFETYSVASFELSAFPDIRIEAVQTRKEKYNDKTSRNPVTAYGTIEDDCMRRDLTINSLYLNVSTGEILDITGHGVEDIRDKRIRTPLDPDDTFDDDPLRMMRVIRFAARFGFHPDPEIIKSVNQNSSRISIISRERIHDELYKILNDKNIGMAFCILSSSGLLDAILSGEFPWLDTSRYKESDWFTFMDNDSSVLYWRDWRTRLAYILISGIDFDSDSMYNADFKKLMRYLKFSCEESEYVESLYRHFLEIRIPRNAVPHFMNRKFYEIKSPEKFKDIMAILSCSGCETGLPDIWYSAAMDNVSEKIGQNFFSYILPVDGDYIMSYFGIGPGIQIKIIQEQMREYVFRNPRAGLIDILNSVKL